VSLPPLERPARGEAGDASSSAPVALGESPSSAPVEVSASSTPVEVGAWVSSAPSDPLPEAESATSGERSSAGFVSGCDEYDESVPTPDADRREPDLLDSSSFPADLDFEEGAELAEASEVPEPTDPSEPVVSANAIGTASSAEPTPRATAGAPTRPI
jgi:hypothetical protein